MYKLSKLIISTIVFSALSISNVLAENQASIFDISVPNNITISDTSNLIDANNLQILAPINEDTYYKYIIKNEIPSETDWNNSKVEPFYKSLTFTPKKDNQWIMLISKNESKIYGLKGQNNTLDPSSPINPWEYTYELGAGFDVTWTQFKSGIESFSETQIVSIKRAGFNHVRLRSTAPATDSELFSFMDKTVELCLRHDIYPIIAKGVKETKDGTLSKSQLDDYVNWWSEVSKRYKDKSNKLAFNLFIEISGKSKLSDWSILNPLYEDITNAIREYSPNRNIIYASTQVSSPHELKKLIVPNSAGDYYFVEWHNWAAGPGKRNGDKLWTTGTDSEKEAILSDINAAKNWSKIKQKPTWVGAWMPGYYNYNDNIIYSEQISFSKFLIESLENEKIPYAVNAFPSHYYDTELNQWKSEKLPLLEVLNGSKTMNSEDIDADGIANIDEINLGTNPKYADTDFDGILDGDELKYGFNPLDSSDGSMDTDGDSMINSVEIYYGFNPLDYTDQYLDPDSDGLINSYEILIKSNPYKYDSRKSGTSDSLADFDKDGMNNIKELKKATDPNSKNNKKNKKK